MPVDPDREFDKTALCASGNQLRVHRDYLAHVFRWGWATRYVGVNQTARVLEAGCGADAPLAQSFAHMAYTTFHPELYVGVDLNSIPYARKRKQESASAQKFRLFEHFNFVTQWRELWEEFGPTFNLAVSFEVIEHMTEEHGDTYLKAINALMPMGGKLMLSTPVYNGRRQAANHIREYTIPELEEKLTRAGFGPVDRFGTFARYHDIKKVAPPEMLAQYERCREFYGDDVMACFLAPLFPDSSCNNAWVREKVAEPWVTG